MHVSASPLNHIKLSRMYKRKDELLTHIKLSRTYKRKDEPLNHIKLSRMNKRENTCMSTRSETAQYRCCVLPSHRSSGNKGVGSIK